MGSAPTRTICRLSLTLQFPKTPLNCVIFSDFPVITVGLSRNLLIYRTRYRQVPLSRFNFIGTEKFRNPSTCLKRKNPPVSAFPYFGTPFLVQTVASGKALGTVLAQRKEDDKIYPIYYAIRILKDAEKKYSTSEGESLAIVFALKKVPVFSCHLNL